MVENLNRREFLTAVAGLTLAGCSSEGGDSGEVLDSVRSRHDELIDAFFAEDLEALVDASEAELDALKADTDVVALVPDGNHILYTAQWWRYMKRQAVARNRPFQLPQVVKDNLHWKYVKVEDPLEATYGIC